MQPTDIDTLRHLLPEPAGKLDLQAPSGRASLGLALLRLGLA